MATNGIAVADSAAAIMEEVIAQGDLSKLTSEQRSRYYLEVCRSVGLNPLTQPFEYLVLKGKTVLYAKKGAAEQLRNIYGINVYETRTQYEDDLVVVTVFGEDRTGRKDSEIGAVTIAGLKGEDKANALMKALTKAKRRLTLSMVGLGMLDESEVEAVDRREDAAITVTEREPQRLPGRSGIVQPDGRTVDVKTGEITQPANSDALQERTASAIKNQAKFLNLADEDINELAVATFNIPDAPSMGEFDGLLLAKLLTYARQIQGAMVTSRLDKIAADMQADPNVEFLIESQWLSERFRAKEAELQAKVAAPAGGR